MSSIPSPFAIQRGENERQGFARVLGLLAIQARRLVQHAEGGQLDLSHEARVLIKHFRALLWFACPAISSSESNPLKNHLRKAAHLLATQRDLAVVQSLMQKIARKTSNIADRITLLRIADAQRSTAKSEQSLPQAMAILLTAIKQLKENARSKIWWPAASERLAKAFRANEKAGAKALRRQKPAQFHDWRKKAKRLLFQLLLTQAAPRKRMVHTIKRVDELQERLGDYHDSVIAQDRLLEILPDELPPRFVKHSAELLENRRRRLRKQVREISARIKSR